MWPTLYSYIDFLSVFSMQTSSSGDRIMHDAAAAKSAVSLVHKPPLKHVLQQELQNTLLLVEPRKIFLSCILNQSEYSLPFFCDKALLDSRLATSGYPACVFSTKPSRLPCSVATSFVKSRVHGDLWLYSTHPSESVFRSGQRRV